MNGDPSSERAVLGGVAQHGYDGYIDVSDIVTTNTFTEDINQILWRCYQYLFETQNCQKIDLPTIMSAGKSLGCEEEITHTDNRQYIRSVLNFTLDKSNLRKLAAKIRNLEITRQLYNTTSEVQAKLCKVTGDERLFQILGIAEEPILNFVSLLDASEDVKKLGDGVGEWLDYVSANPCNIVGISTGYPEFDEAIGGGMRPGTVSLVGARPKTGKSFWAMNTALFVADKLGLPVFLGDTEMMEKDIYPRALACLSGVPYRDIEKGTFAENSAWKDKVYRAKDALEKMPFYYRSLVGMTMDEMLPVFRRWLVKDVGKDKQGLMILDYIKVANSEEITEGLQEYQKLGFYISGLHNFCAKHQVPCLAFVQLNKEKQIAAADRQLWGCSNFSQFLVKDMAEQAANGGPQFGNRKVIPLYSRQGGCLEDGDYINFMLDGKVARLKEGKRRNAIKENDPLTGFENVDAIEF